MGVYMASITLGVAALVSIHSFRDDVARSVQEEADVLMGANARLEANRPFPDSVTRVVDSLRAAGVETARVTTALSMVLAPASGDVRLMQVQAMDEGYPFYGAVTTDPPGLWGSHVREDVALVDPAVLTQLRVRRGDTLYSISKKYGVSIERLRRLNRISKGQGLRIGQKIFLPPTSG